MLNLNRTRYAMLSWHAYLITLIAVDSLLWYAQAIQ